MAQRALVVASQTAGLTGATGDAERVAHMLEAIDFRVDLRVAQLDASREGILDGYRGLIERTQLGDAVVIYYAGHGMRVLPATGGTTRAAHEVRPIQGIVPSDFALSTPGDFRGILDVELSVLLAQLTRRTANATVILDCCHSAAVSRSIDEQARALAHPCYVDLQRHLARAEQQGRAVDLLAPAGNPLAVRLVAAGQSQSAYERLVGNQMVGTFTESLLMALAEAGDERVTWDAVIRSVRERVLGFHAEQRPDVEGPRRRYVFDVAEAPASGAITVVDLGRPGYAKLRAGRIHGVQMGDQYAVLASETADPARPLARATVTQVEANAATLQLVPSSAVVPANAHGVQLVAAAPRRGIQLIAEGRERELLARAIEDSGRFVLVDDRGFPPAGSADGGPRGSIEQTIAAVPLLATVRVSAGHIELRRPSGLPVVPPIAMSDAHVNLLVDNLRMLTAAQHLQQLASDSTELTDDALDVSWGLVERGEPVAMPMSGELMGVNDRLFVRVTNKHADRTMFIHIFDLGVAQRILLVTTGWPAGYELAAGETFTLGEDADRTLQGIPLGWSKNLPPDTVRTETLVVLATEEPADLSALQTPGANGGWATTRSVASTSPLQQLVAQLQYGGKRELVADAHAPGQRADGFLVQRISFELSPWPLERPSVDARKQLFLCDESPPSSARLSLPRALLRGPARDQRTIAIRITELAIHNTRSWFGSSDIRIDSLAITRAAENGREPYRAETWRFNGINDGELLPIDNALVYHGPVRDFVDLRIWASRDRSDSKSLSELFSEQLNSTEFQQAATALLAVGAAAATAAPIVAAIGAAATMTTIAWRVLARALPRSIGLYQTSLLAGEGEGFGQGFHPPTGALRAQGFSLRYEVVLVD